MELNRKERWLNALEGKETDRLVFWPKIFSEAYGRNQKSPFNRMSVREIFDYTGTDMHIFLPNYIDHHFNRFGYSEVKQENLFIKTYNTPQGDIKNILRYDSITDSYHPEIMAIKNRNDIISMTAFFQDLRPKINEDKLEKARILAKEFGERGLVADTIGESPMMDFLEWYAGIENGQYLLADYPEEIEGLFNAMHNFLIECTRLKCQHSHADVLYFIENTSTTIISPAQFIEFCKKPLSIYAEICKSFGRRLLFHMCGHLKEILQELRDIPFLAIEALSSPPIGNTTFLDACTALPGKSFIGGTNCLTWLQSPSEIIFELDGYLTELENWRHIIIGTGGIIPPACSPETLTEVANYLYSLPMKK